MPRTTSSTSVKFISLDRQALLSRLRVMAGRIAAARPDLVDVRLFGSLARGDHTGTSDVDVFVIVEHSGEADPIRRILAFLPFFDLERDVQVLVYTREEMESRLREGDPFVTGAWGESLSLLDRRERSA